jgi:hypothetical protein
MKRAIVVVTLLLAAAGYVFLQTPAPGRDLATLMPGGAALYLEAQDFGSLVREWDASKVKADWLSSNNYAVFSRSDLFQKLGGVYREYGDTAGFLPDLKSVAGLAGTHSALALYDIRGVEFLYVTRMSQAQFTGSALAAVRDKFEKRQAGAVPFYLRTDPGTNRTVAFAVANGYLFLATRDDLIGRALELLSGSTDPGVASEPWFHEASAAAARRGELRMVMNLDALAKSVYFRSYWVQRNVSAVREFWAGVADVNRSRTAITENRVFLRRPEQATQEHVSGQKSLAQLVALVPPDAGMYKAWAGPSAPDPAALIVSKLIAAPPRTVTDHRSAPAAASIDERVGTEADLETRIDEPPMPADSGLADARAVLKAMIGKRGVEGALIAQSTEPAAETFVRTPTVIVLAGSSPWEEGEIRSALSAATGALWTVSGIGANWTTATLGRRSAARLDGLGSILFSVQGSMLFVGNDARLFAGVLDRVGSPPAGTPATYAAGFRHTRERANYESIMRALDFNSPSAGARLGVAFESGVPAFFSGNLGSLSRVLDQVAEVSINEEDGPKVVQRVVYRLTR